MIFTIGYSKWDVKAVRAKMEELRISLLVDLRSTPYGRFNPTFNRLALIAAFGARYVWKGDVLAESPDQRRKRASSGSSSSTRPAASSC